MGKWAQIEALDRVIRSHAYRRSVGQHDLSMGRKFATNYRRQKQD
jgi:hypothetical protein